MKWISLILLIITLNSFSMTPVKKDDTVPYDGYLFNNEEEKKIRQINEEKIKLEDLNILKDKKIELQDLRINNYQNYVEDTKDLKPLGSWERVGWFFLGVLSTGVGFYTTSKIIKNSNK